LGLFLPPLMDNVKKLYLKVYSWPVIFSLSFVSKWFFVGKNYGTEEDSYGQIVNAFEIWESSSYIASRLPGHPIYDLLLAAMYPRFIQPIFTNSVSLLSLLFACYFLWKLLNSFFGSQYAWFAVLVFSQLPAVFNASVVTIDYMPTMAFLLGGFWFNQKGKPIMAGLFFALATGYRINSVVYAPAALIFKRKSNFFSLKFSKNEWLLGLSTLLFCVLFYMPVFSSYGWGFFSHANPPYPEWTKIVYNASFRFWGVIGICWFFISLRWFLKEKKFTINPAIFLGLLLTFAIYLRFPFKTEFLIPALPFVFMAFGSTQKEKNQFIWSLLFLLNPFILGLYLVEPIRGANEKHLLAAFGSPEKKIGFFPLKGNAFCFKEERLNKENFVLQLDTVAHLQSEKSAVVSAYFYNLIWVKQHFGELKAPFLPIDYLSEDSLSNLLTQGYQVFYLPKIDEINKDRFPDFELNSQARPIFETKP
jgi:hypothetical protein